MNSKDYLRELEVDVLARTLWGEARGEGVQGMEAVACIILNRIAVAQDRGRYWWGNDVIGVCQKPFQFSCWNRNDPNFKGLQDVDSTDIHFATALRIARRTLIGSLADCTNGATHYHTQSTMPFWAEGQEAVAHIGHHIFYRILD